MKPWQSLLLITCSISLISYYGLLQPQWQQLRQQRQLTPQLQHQLANHQQQIARLPDCQAQLTQLQEQLTPIQANLPQPSGHALTKLVEYITHAGLRIQELEPQSEQTNPWYRFTPVQVIVQGTFPAFNQLIERLIASPTPIHLHQFSMKTRHSSSNQLLIDISFHIPLALPSEQAISISPYAESGSMERGNSDHLIVPTAPKQSPITLARDPFAPASITTLLQFNGTIATQQQLWALITTPDHITHQLTLGENIPTYALQITQITPHAVTLLNTQLQTHQLLALNEETT